MSRTINHRDGSRTVVFDNGRKVRFGSAQKPGRKATITGTPYIFARGPKIELPEGVAHGMIFEYRKRTYVALKRTGVDSLGRRITMRYGQPITLTRPV